MAKAKKNEVSAAIKQASKQVAKTIKPRRVRHFFSELGPGLITGAADDDPSGISTYSVTGAAFGYAPLWTALFSFPLMSAVQMMCARRKCFQHWCRPGRDGRSIRNDDRR
jgi:hypothetical protein